MSQQKRAGVGRFRRWRLRRAIARRWRTRAADWYSTVVEPIEVYRAVGWMTMDGELHRGCPPINAPTWTTVYVRDDEVARCD